MYRERMNGYYPQVLQSIVEFQAILDSESPEIESIHNVNESILEDAYLTTMNEDRIAQWEKILGIAPIRGSSVSDRRETVIARIRGQGKLNTELINLIVKTFTGGTAKSKVRHGVLYIEITPPPGNKSYQFANVEQELVNKIPAHLGYNIKRNYNDWSEIKKNYSTWQDILDGYDTWHDVYIFNPFE